MQLVKHLSTAQIMRQVIYALLPIFIVSFILFGFSFILQVVLAIFTAISIDIIMAKIQNKTDLYFVNDYSSILTALLLAISIPSIAPWWIIIVGVSFALIFAKYIYGGLGNNIFNPAMVGYVFLLISYPAHLATWQMPMSFVDFSQVFNNFDSISGATLLDSAKNNLPNFKTQNYTFLLSIAAIIGGIYLLIKKIISWHIPVAIIISSSIVIIIINLLIVEHHVIMLHLFAGGFFFAIFFIATDPVSTCTTNKGRIIFGIMVGILLIIIRSFGNYPDGIAFAILIINMFVPLIDYYIRDSRW